MISILEETKFLLKQNKILPSKSKGQNFLISEKVLDQIIQFSNLKEKDNVLEIGPGLGTLTKALLKQKVNLKVIELDKDIIKLLKSLARMNNFTLIEGDVLKINLEKELSKDFLKNYKIVANLPYNITSRFLRIFLEHQYPPQEMVIMLQKEVAERIINKDGKWSKLSVMCNFYSQPEYLFTVAQDSFLPEPAVDSAVIKFKINPGGCQPPGLDQKKFWQLINIGFSSKRRTLANNLSHGFKIKKEEIVKVLNSIELNENIRAEKLEIQDWINLVNINF